MTNLAFIAAGLWGVRQVRRYETGTFAKMLAWWVVVIGIGSTLFPHLRQQRHDLGRLRQASNGTTSYLPPFLALAFFGA